MMEGTVQAARDEITDVSVIMPAYNAEKFIAEAIESVLCQTWRRFEFIIVDDGSTDRTLDIAKRYAKQDSRIRVFSEPNSGAAIAANTALEVAQNEWVVRIDADDIMEANRIERQCDFVRRQGQNLAVASSFLTYVDERGRLIGKSESPLVNNKAVHELKMRGELIGIPQGAAIMRKSVVERVGGYRGQFQVAEDIDLWTRIADAGYDIVVQPEYLLRYRIHGNSLSIRNAKTGRTQLRWLKACVSQRRKGLAEPTWAEFVAQRNRVSCLIRINEARRDWAKALYKAATVHLSARRYVRLAVTFGAAALLQPGYVIRQASSKVSVSSMFGRP